MPAISKIRLTNVVYEDGEKRFNDEVFLFDGHNGAILLENGGGKTVFIHTVLQAILPHTHLGERKIKETLQLENAPAHIAIEWLIHERPRRYVTTAVSLFLYNHKLDSYRYAFEYEEGNPDALVHMPFVKEMNGKKRPAYKEEMADYYSAMKSKTHNAQTFDTIRSFHHYIEENYQIITNEWESVVKINRDEGGIEGFFENCKTTTDLYDRLLIPTVEESIAGHEKGMFADMFEKQREGFQTYRHLQKSMQEHKAIQLELEKYVAEFEQFSARQKAYDVVKQRAKGLAETISTQRMDIESRQATNRSSWDMWQGEERRYQIKEASFQILEEREKMKDFERAHLQELSHFEEIKERLRVDKHHFYSLQYAQKRQAYATNEQLRDQYKEELEKHEQESDVETYEEELEKVNAKLHGYFLTDIEKLEKAVTGYEIERRPIEEEIRTLKEKRAKEQAGVEEEKGRLHRLEGQMETLGRNLHHITQEILANPEQENVEEAFHKWTERYQWLDEEMIRLKQRNKEMQKEVEERTLERDRTLQAVSELDIELHDKRRDQRAMQDAHDVLVGRLAELRPSWKSITDLHLKESSVYGSLYELSEKLQREREELLLKERLARRFVDDYDEQEEFFSDSFLETRVADWKNQFYVATGTEFLQDVPAEDKAVFEKYPLWALTLVTTKADRAKLVEKLGEVKDRLQYPISVLTLEEGKQMGTGEWTGTWVAPAHWETNVDAEQFLLWKNDLRVVAEETTERRVLKEKEGQHCHDVLREFEQFFHTYPAEEKEKLMETLRSLETEKETRMRTVHAYASEIEQLKRKMATAADNLETYRDEWNGLGGVLEKANRYFQEKRDLVQLREKRKESEKKVETFEQNLRDVQRAIERYEEEKAVLDDEIRESRTQIQVIQADDVYKEVKSVPAIFSDEEKEVMLKRRESLTFDIRGLQQTYGELVVKLEQAEKDMVRIAAEMKQVQQTYEEVDLEMEFPVDGERLLARVREDVKRGEVEEERVRNIVTEKHVAFVDQRARVKTMEETFTKEFPNEAVEEFEVDLAEIPPFLGELQRKLEERKRYLQEESKRLEAEQKEVEAASQHLDRFEEAHQFTSTVVLAITLSEKEVTEFTYQRMAFVKKMTQQLREQRDALEAGREKIDQAKRRFYKFCREEITERKLREMATTGIELKQTYEDVLQFQENMLTTVERADQYARNYISETDKEVQAFINTLHNHLVNVVEQLQVIPNNTKVKVGENWKRIFHFSIPEWKEEDGKSRIRAHIDWILEQLEADRFKQEHGLEDRGKIRKEVETWLDTKALLQVVMENKAMKVSCRKVTNDNEVSRRHTSWEQSNKWSGGEKWSKNMTLFLGILNFVAEKKQHIQKGMKRHRAVILDNPFGKASSDHVLSPVFFIAEQLGFQIIALTAHADGKFLQDYFPIIYSLKLRTAEGSKQVMTKEKSLHHAYFQDHAPEEMERLEQKEQMELF